MKKTIFCKIPYNRAQAIPVAVGFLLLPTMALSQTQKQVQAIRKNSDLSTLGRLKSVAKAKKPEAIVLKKKASEKGIVFSGQSKDQRYQLVAFDKKGRGMYYVTTNVGAARGTNTDKLNSTGGIFNLDGQDMRVYEWDGGGVLTTHREFEGRVIQKDSADGTNFHATHVAGTMVAAGVNALAKGMAPKANLDAYEWTSDEVEMTQAAIDGALVSNHSYGYVSGFYYDGSRWLWMGDDEDTEYRPYGKYSMDDARLDLLTLNAPYYLPVKAAGNPTGDGPEPGGLHYVQIYNQETKKWEWVASNKVRQKNGGEYGYDDLSQGAMAKNHLVVGAAEKISKLNGYEKPEDVRMAYFSGFGPVDDGRIKPDITGIGVDIYSTNNSGNEDYTTMSGTSMASPNVSGSLLLLQQHYKNENNGTFMKAATLKALAIGTANEAGAAPGPDYKSGWGLLNAFKAAQTISANNKFAQIAEKTLRNKATDKITVKANGLEPLKITVVWADPAPGALPGEDLNDRKIMLVNDLDIRVKYNGETFMPWKLDPVNPRNAALQGDNTVDNVEQIVIPNPVAGATYQIEISHKGDLMKNKLIYGADGEVGVELEKAAFQDYSVVITGINNNVQKDLELKTIVVKAEQEDYSTNTPVVFEIVNKTAVTATGAKLRYQLVDADNSNSVSQNGEISLEDIAANSTLLKEVVLDLTTSFKNYKVTGEIIFEGDEVAANNKATSNVYGIISDLTPEKTIYRYGFETNMLKDGWKAEDVDQDGKTWGAYSGTYVNNGKNAALNFPNKITTGVNDWLYSNPLKMKAGVKYRIAFNARKLQTYNEVLSLSIGKSAVHTAMDTSVSGDIALTNTAYPRYVYTFTPTEDGIYYLGFNHKVPGGQTSYAALIDDVYIDQSNNPIVDFKASPTTANSVTPIKLTDNSTADASGPITYSWSFTPNTVTFTQNTTASSKDPVVIFNKEGKYSVTHTVTDKNGTGTLTKVDYITIANVAAKANFYTARPKLYQGDRAAFTNSSSGDPKPTEFKWTVTPSEGVEYTDGTTSTSAEPVIRFNKPGKYTVGLQATNVVGPNYRERQDYIEVVDMHNPVKNLKAAAKESAVQLDWSRPTLAHNYLEDFEGYASLSKVKMPKDLTIINANGDAYSWELTASNFSGYKSIGVRTSMAWSNGKGVDEWLILPKQKAGSELLEYMVGNAFPEVYKIYIAEAPADGSVPATADFKNLVYTSDSSTTNMFDFVYRKHNIRQFTDKDFFVAFHCVTPQEPEGLQLKIDDIAVGYENNEPKTFVFAPEAKTTKPQEDLLEEQHFLDGARISITSDGEMAVAASDAGSNLVVNSFYPTTVFTLVGYEVERDGTLLTGTVQAKSATDFSYTDVNVPAGDHKYTVYAVYTDGTRIPVSVQVSGGSLSTVETKANGLKIYPNPSDGLFTIESPTGTSSVKAEVYDASGKLVFAREFRGNKAQLDLTSHPAGVYILALTNDKGEKQTAKLLVK